MMKYIITTFIILLLFTGTECKKNGGNIIIPPDTTVTPIDTTSHNFSWTQYTFGGIVGSSYFKDVAIVNDSDIWAVGGIYSDSSFYNAAHWDGSKWELRKITVNFRGNLIIPPLEGIFSFSATNIWVSSGVPAHYDGNSWTQYHLFDMGILSSNDGSVNKIWGTSSQNIFIVGNKGTIVHYNGTIWTKLESGTTLDIQDIWGAKNETSGEYEIVAVASTPFSSFDRKILRITNNTVAAISDSGIHYALSSAWFTPGEHYYVGGSGIYEKSSLNEMQWNNQALDITKYYTYRIRGNRSNDVVAVGGTGEIIHFNGKSWYSYFETVRLNNGNYYGVDLKGNVIVAVGIDNPKGIIELGKHN